VGIADPTAFLHQVDAPDRPHGADHAFPPPNCYNAGSVPPTPCRRTRETDYWQTGVIAMPFAVLAELAQFSPEKMRKHNFFDTPQMVADVYALEPGQCQPVHHHAAEAKLYCVLTGRGDFTVGDATRTLGPGETAAAPPGVAHGVANPYDQRLTALVVLAPNPNLRTTS
jgi:mannose-6-phosphate isomerase-like protein (cupin superfamily)